MSYSSETVQRLVDQYQTDEETIRRYLDLKEEGYTTYQSNVMSGLSDPDYDE